MPTSENPSRSEEHDPRTPTAWSIAADVQLTAGFTTAVVVAGFGALLHAPSIGVSAAVELALAVLLWRALPKEQTWAPVAAIARSAVVLVVAALALLLGAYFYKEGGTRFANIILVVLLVLALPVLVVVRAEVSAVFACARALRARN